MAGNKNTKYDGMSASKAKRERAKDEREQVKRAATRNKAIGIGIIVLIAALIGAAYGRRWYIEKNKTVASTDYSAMLNDDGTIKDVNVADYVKTFDVNAVKIASADVEYTDEKMQEDINAQLSNHRALNADAALAVKDMLRVVDDQRHLREAQSPPLLRAAEDHVLHLGAAQRTAALLAHDPEDGVGNVGLSGAVGAYDGRDILFECEPGLVREGLEALDLECL